MKSVAPLAFCTFALCWLVTFTPVARAQATPTLTTLHQFSRPYGPVNTDGIAPNASLIQGSDGNFYGAATQGGAYGAGAVFRVTPGGAQTILHSFSSSEDGSAPQSTLILGSDGNFYGTASYGGPNGTGTVFRITPDGTFTVLYAFGALIYGDQVGIFTNADGAIPFGALVQGSDGNFYGTTLQGGSDSVGTAFQLTPDGVLTTLYAFGSAEDYHIDSPRDGAAPNGALVEGSDGNFYGTTSGGGSNGNGTIFQLTKDGTLTTLYRFSVDNAAAGYGPAGGLIQGSDGNFYGTTQYGGTDNNGTIFQITPAGGFTTLYTFNGEPDSSRPRGSLLQGSDGSFYGTTYAGGTQQFGTAFRFTPGGGLTVLHSFSRLQGGGGPTSSPPRYNNDGAYPVSALVQGSDGNFYGTAPSGGTKGNGVVFQITPAGTFTTLHTLKAGTYSNANRDGSSPTGTLFQGPDGDFYGTTPAGGSAGGGTFFKVAPDGLLTVLYNFSLSVNSLIPGSDGNFYGTTENGGATLYGTAFRLTPDGVLTVLHDFTQMVSNPISLTQGSDGNFYGLTSGGSGAYQNGTVFRLTPAGAFTILYGFGSSNALPYGALVQGSDGNFYGVTAGTVYRITPEGALTILHRFDYNTEGMYPLGGLVQGSDGNFYVANNRGGAPGNGTVVQVTPDGTATILYAFADLGHPFAALIEGQDGNFYGTTDRGGTQGQGSVFQVTPDGAATTLHSFGKYYPGGSTNSDGAFPQGSLVQGSDGSFFGTTSAGGTSGAGTVFKLTVPPPPAVVTLAAPKRVIDENGDRGNATVYVRRQGGDLSAPLVVGLRFLGDAVNGIDYKKVKGTITIPAGATQAKFLIRPLHVGLAEGSKTVQIKFKASADGTYVPGRPRRLILTINENDPVSQPPVLTSSGSVTARVGEDFAYQITATNLPNVFTANALPAGLSFDPAQGLITGRISQTGTYQVAISASNDFGTSAATFQLVVSD